MCDNAFGWEREEWRNAVEAAEDAGEVVDDRPTYADLFWDFFDPQEEDDDE